MASNHGRICRDLFGGALFIKGKEVMDAQRNTNIRSLKVGKNGKFGGNVNILGDLCVDGVIKGLPTSPIRQSDFVAGVLTLSESGHYAATEDLTGVVVITSDNVCLNLGCFCLDAAGAANAVSATGFKNIVVSGGHIKNTSASAVCMTNCKNVSVGHTLLTNHTLEGLKFVGCTDVTVKNVTKCDGDRSLHFFDSCGIHVCDVSLTDHTVVTKCAVLVDQCVDVNLTLIQLSKSIRNLSAPPANPFDGVGTGMFGVNLSKNVNILKCQFHDLARQDAGSGFRAIHLLDTDNVVLSECQVDKIGEVSPASVDEDYIEERHGITTSFCDNVFIDRCQVNNLYSQPNSKAGSSGIIGFFCENLKIEGCNISDVSTTDQLWDTGPFAKITAGIQIFMCSGILEIVNNLVTNVKSNRNDSANPTDIIGFACGIVVQQGPNSIVIKSNTVTNIHNTDQRAAGIHISGPSNYYIVEDNFVDNILYDGTVDIAGDFGFTICAGIWLESFGGGEPTIQRNIVKKVVSTGTQCASFGIVAAFTNSNILDNVVTDVFCAAGEAFGIGSNNFGNEVRIKNNKVSNIITEGIRSSQLSTLIGTFVGGGPPAQCCGIGITDIFGTSLTVSDCHVFGVSGNSFVTQGILGLYNIGTTVKNCHVENIRSSTADSAGISSSGFPSNIITIKDNIVNSVTNVSGNAYGVFLENNNGGSVADNCVTSCDEVGFEDLNDPINVRYFGNYAGQNAFNYHANIAPLQSLDVNGDFTNIQGNATLGARFVNISHV